MPIQQGGVESFHAPNFSAFSKTCASVAGTRSKLEKVRLLAEYLRTLDPENLGRVVVWFTGVPFAASEHRVLQLGWALLRDALCAASGVSEEEFHRVYLKHSDVGETAFEILQGHEPQPPAVTLAAVDLLFREIATARGPGAKRPLLLRALAQCSALEAKMLVKIFTSDLRIGLKEGLVEEGIAFAFGVKPEDVRQANLLLGHIGQTARLAAQNKLAAASVTPFRPLKFMLASPEETPAGIWKRMRGGDVLRVACCVTNQGSTCNTDHGAGNTQHATPNPAASLWLEDKYDGIRCQLHKVGERVALYSRDLKDITMTFPDVADSARLLRADVILDGEIVAMRGEAVLPFADLQKRLGRREPDLFLSEEIPIQFVAFDLLWIDTLESTRRLVAS